MSAALKYTDRDVRLNPAFYAVAVDYVFDYQGEFQYLLDCRERITSGGALTVGMVRGVLNCMRTDPRAPILPEPLPPEDFEADVIPLNEDRQYRKYGNRYDKRFKKECTRTDVHSHSFEDWETTKFCPGIYLANREPKYRMPATVHPEYIFTKGKSKSTLTIHLVTGAEIEWYPNIHTWGWAKEPEMIVHTACRYPYYLRNSLLLTPAMILENKLDPEQTPFFRCGHCFEEEE